MPSIETTKRVTAFLKILKKKLSKPKEISITETLRGNKMPPDYGKFIIKAGLIIKVDGGKRGPATYQWNNEHLANQESAIKVINKYNTLRTNEARKRGEIGKPKRPTIESHLIDIKKMLTKIIRLNGAKE